MAKMLTTGPTQFAQRVGLINRRNATEVENEDLVGVVGGDDIHASKRGQS